MNIYMKLQQARVTLQSMNLKKTGVNKFAGYKYYELGDFLPAVNSIMNDLKMCGFVTFSNDSANLTIVNAENPEETIVFSSPMRDASLKGAHEIQNLGAVETYQRRYLYQVAFEIVESDALDYTQNPNEAVRDDKRSNTGKDTNKHEERRVEPSRAVSSDSVSEPVICADCGAPITQVMGKNGKPITADVLVDLSMKTYNVPLCATCQKKRKEAK